MQSSQQLDFLKEKIQDLGSAIFFNLSDSVLKFPTSLVNNMEVDDLGYVWFWVQKPRQYIREFENGFPVRMDFYRKGKQYFLQVTGKAWVVTDPEEINTLSTLGEATLTHQETDMVLMKVKMMRAEYHETQTSHANSWWQNVVHNIATWFRSSNGYTSGNTYFPAS
jgi:general stress protein 26